MQSVGFRELLEILYLTKKCFAIRLNLNSKDNLDESRVYEQAIEDKDASWIQTLISLGNRLSVPMISRKITKFKHRKMALGRKPCSAIMRI